MCARLAGGVERWLGPKSVGRLQFVPNISAIKTSTMITTSESGMPNQMI
jgi:hypothetical protein